MLCKQASTRARMCIMTKYNLNENNNNKEKTAHLGYYAIVIVL